MSLSIADDPFPEEHFLGQFIPLHYHFNMLLDESRMVPFQEAIARIVPDGGRVVELGGGTGVLSYFAAQRAAQVWCVERNPALARAARGFLANNQHGDRVEVVQADAMTFVPPEPVDVVICEMLHVGLIREKQTEVLQAFKENYTAAFGPKLPTFIPEASLLGVQLLQQDFCFSGYTAEVPMFQPPGPQPQSRVLSEPVIYSTIFWRQEIPTEFDWHGEIAVTENGVVNALGFLTNNFLAFVLEEQRAEQWLMNQLILPLPEPVRVWAGDVMTVRLDYAAGCPLEALQESLTVERRPQILPMRRAA